MPKTIEGGVSRRLRVLGPREAEISLPGAGLRKSILGNFLRARLGAAVLRVR